MTSFSIQFQYGELPPVILVENLTRGQALDFMEGKDPYFNIFMRTGRWFDPIAVNIYKSHDKKAEVRIIKQ